MIVLNNSLVIAGAGPTGIAAAISAARSGCRVVLLEKQPTIGGTVAGSLIHTLGGLYDDAGNYLNQGLSIELSERLSAADVRVTKRKIGRTWCLSVDPALFQKLMADWLREEPAITLMTDSVVTGGVIVDAELSSLDLRLQGEPAQCQPAAALDATGSAAGSTPGLNRCYSQASGV
jgi:2-polyprenyl-6-methoxyphenol hydroxylase-like FAD-dependent oxidoreductase